MQVTLRSATDDDLDFAYRVRKEAMEDYVVLTWGTWAEDWQRERHDSRWDASATRIILGDDRPAGWLRVSAADDHLFLEGIYLLPEFQGHGIGSEVVGRVQADASRVGKAVRLTVLKVNPALRLYERLGFQRYGDDDNEWFLQSGP